MGSTLTGDSHLDVLRMSKQLILDRLEILEMFTIGLIPGSVFRFSSKGVISSSRLSSPLRELGRLGSVFTGVKVVGGRIPKPDKIKTRD